MRGPLGCRNEPCDCWVADELYGVSRKGSLEETDPTLFSYKLLRPLIPKAPSVTSGGAMRSAPERSRNFIWRIYATSGATGATSSSRRGCRSVLEIKAIEALSGLTVTSQPPTLISCPRAPHFGELPCGMCISWRSKLAEDVASNSRTNCASRKVPTRDGENGRAHVLERLGNAAKE